MPETQNSKFRVEEIDLLPIIDGEIIEASLEKEKTNEIEDRKTETRLAKVRKKDAGQKPNIQSAYRNYLLIPFLFLIVTLLGGLRLSAETSSLLFLKPELVCLIFAVVLLLLFFRTKLIELEGWFSERFSTASNIANAAVLFTLFTASVQVFNSLLPERGLPFWIIGLLFFWTLWNNLFSIFDAKKLLQSLGGLFGLAFVVKYLILASLSFAGEATWTQKILEGVMKEASFGLIDLPKFTAGTGYIQFFTLVFYLLGLFLLKPTMDEKE